MRRSLTTLLTSTALLAAPLGCQAQEWPPALQLQYDLDGSYLGLPLHGRGSLDWWRQDDHYRVALSGSSMIGASYRSQGRIADGWLQPERYEQQLFVRNASVEFDRSHGVLLFSSGAPPQSIPQNMQDSASVFAQLTQMMVTRNDWKPGQSLDFDLARPSGVAHWSFVLVDQPWLETGLGRLQCWHLRVHTPQGEPGDEVWLAPRLRDLPVRIRLQQGDNFLLFALHGASLPLEALENAPSSKP